MIRKLKLRFICLAMGALLLVLAVCVAGMNALNYSTVVQDADSVLSILSRNRGVFPLPERDRPGQANMPRPLSPETPYESRYFSVLTDSSGKVIRTETGRITSVDSEEAAAYAKHVLDSGETSGFSGDFRYLRSREGDGFRITFLDCGRKLDAFYTYLWISIGMTFAGLVVMFFAIVFFAGKIVRPIAESYEKQKRFITDAGHEIKTPLTIINANIDLLEADPKDADCLHDIRQQTQRLAALTNDLIYLARMEESDGPKLSDLAVSDVLSETAAAFHALAVTQKKELTCRIQPALFMKGDDRAIRQLINLLLDNALKYSPEGGVVALHFAQIKKTLQLDICNTVQTAVDSEELTHVFERFYRTDKSRNSETGGHGIGLSVAKAIVEAHHGKIRAWTQDGFTFHITCTFPV